jgi:hypothetical protein
MKDAGAKIATKNIVSVFTEQTLIAGIVDILNLIPV